MNALHYQRRHDVHDLNKYGQLASYTQQLHSISVNHSPNPTTNPNPNHTNPNSNPNLTPT